MSPKSPTSQVSAAPTISALVLKKSTRFRLRISSSHSAVTKLVFNADYRDEIRRELIKATQHLFMGKARTMFPAGCVTKILLDEW